MNIFEDLRKKKSFSTSVLNTFFMYSIVVEDPGINIISKLSYFLRYWTVHKTTKHAERSRTLSVVSVPVCHEMKGSALKTIYSSFIAPYPTQSLLYLRKTRKETLTPNKTHRTKVA